MTTSQINSSADTVTWPVHKELTPTEPDTESQPYQDTENKENTSRKRKYNEPTTPSFKEPPSSEASPTAPFKRAYHHVRGFLETSPEAQKTVRLAWEMQHCGREGQVVEETDLSTKKRRVTNGAIYIDKRRAGKGAQSTATFCHKISTEKNGTPIKFVVVKEGGRALEREKKLYDQQFPESDEPLYINRPKKLFFLPEKGKWMAEYDACVGDLSKVDYRRDDPATHAINLLLGFVKGTQALHEHGVVHRDLKALNLFFDKNGLGVVGDLGLMMLIPKKGETHRTTLTPTYAASFIWPNILGQKTREGGHQDEAADVYALGCVISRDILKPMIVQLFEKYKLDPEPYLNAMKPDKKEGQFSDEELLDIEKNHDGQAVYFPIIKGDRVYLFPSRKSEYDVTAKAISQLEGQLSKQEICQMQNLATLAYKFRGNDPDTLTIPDLKSALEQLIKNNNKN